MKTKTKKLINVQPKSKKAINRFKNQMDSLHAMEVEQETDDKFFLASINQTGEHNGNATYDMSLQSSGVVTFTPGV